MDKKQVSKIFHQNIKERDTSVVKINGEDYRIDNSIEQIVRILNSKYDVNTTSSCSGVLSEHYKLDNIEDKVSYAELKNLYGRPPRGYMLMKRPILFTDSFLHGDFSNNSVEVDTKFYGELIPSLSISPPPHMKRDIQWKVDVGEFSGDWQDGNKKDVEYTFQLTLASRRNIIMECQSYQQYDSAIKKSLNGLEEAIDKVLD